MFLFIDRQQKTLGTCIHMHQNLFSIYFMVEGGHRILCIQYSYSAKFLRMNIFDICIRSGTLKQMYSIFIFGQVARHKYIRYSYWVSCLDMNIFDNVFGYNFFYEYIRIGSRILYSFIGIGSIGNCIGISISIGIGISISIGLDIGSIGIGIRIGISIFGSVCGSIWGSRSSSTKGRLPMKVFFQ